MIGTIGERESWKSVPAARLDDNTHTHAYIYTYIYIYIYIYIYKLVINPFNPLLGAIPSRTI